MATCLQAMVPAPSGVQPRAAASCVWPAPGRHERSSAGRAAAAAAAAAGGQGSGGSVTSAGARAQAGQQASRCTSGPGSCRAWRCLAGEPATTMEQHIHRRAAGLRAARCVQTPSTPHSCTCTRSGMGRPHINTHKTISTHSCLAARNSTHNTSSFLRLLQGFNPQGRALRASTTGPQHVFLPASSAGLQPAGPCPAAVHNGRPPLAF